MEEEAPTPPQDAYPHALFSLAELQSLLNILWAYSQHIHHLPATPKTLQQKQTLTKIQEELTAQLQSSTTNEVHVLLTLDELHVILDAMLAYVTLVKRLFPKTEKREVALGLVNMWRLHLTQLIAEVEGE